MLFPPCLKFFISPESLVAFSTISQKKVFHSLSMPMAVHGMENHLETLTQSHVLATIHNLTYTDAYVYDRYSNNKTINTDNISITNPSKRKSTLGDSKENEHFWRSNYHSDEKVHKEFMLHAMGRNIYKYYRFLHQEIEKSWKCLREKRVWTYQAEGVCALK